MKYQIIFLSVFLVGSVTAINLSGLLSDSSSNQSTSTTSAPTTSASNSQESTDGVTSSSNVPLVSKKSVNLGDLVSDTSSMQLIVNSNKKTVSGVTSLDNFLDSDYQNALNILNDLESNKIYDSYLASIRESFMTYYIMNTKALKKITKKRQVVDLSTLEQLSNQPVVKKKAKHLSTFNLASLTDVSVVKKVKRKEKVLNIDQFLNKAESLVVVKAAPTVHSVNLTNLQQQESPVDVPKKAKSKSNNNINLSSLASLNKPTDTDAASTPVKKNTSKKVSNLSSLLNN